MATWVCSDLAVPYEIEDNDPKKDWIPDIQSKMYMSLVFQNFPYSGGLLYVSVFFTLKITLIFHF